MPEREQMLERMRSRRRVLSGVAFGLVGLSGCLVGFRSVRDITVYNQSGSEITATITVVRLPGQSGLADETGSRKRLLHDEFTLPARGSDDLGPRQTYGDVVGTDTARVTIAVEEGPEESREFADNGTDTRGLTAEIHAESIAYSVSVA